MKKTKLLMPLTGIAAIGAIAPVVVMTGCNKGDKATIFESIVLENEGLYGATSHTQANETIDVPVKATLKNLEGTHVWKHEITKDQYSANSILKVAKMDEAKVEGYNPLSGSKTFYGTLPVIVTKDASAITADEELTFTVKYNEYDSGKTDAKLVATQNVNFTVKLVKAKADRPVVDQPDGFTGTRPVAPQTSTTLSGLALHAAVADATKYTLSFVGTEDLIVKEDKTTLTIKKDAAVTLDPTGMKNITCVGSVVNSEGTLPTGKITFKLGANDGFVLTLKFVSTDDTLVKTTWTQDIMVPGESEFEIAAA